MADDDPASPPATADRFGFAWDIAMAIRQTHLYRGRGQKLSFDEKLSLARTILEHLRISGVILTRTPPIHGHGRPPPADPDRK
jgi:hypothetical protein